MQPGVGYNLTAGQAGITLAIDDPQLAGDPEQFRVTVMKTGSGYGVQVRKGTVFWPSYRNGDAWAFCTLSGEIQDFFCYPTGSKTVGPFADAKDSPLLALGGYVQIQPASVEGGSNSWGVYIVGAGGTDYSSFTPYIAVMADDSDAEVKSRHFNGFNDQIIYRNTFTTTPIDVITPTGTTTITIQNPSTLHQYNYNCQRYKVATLTFEGGTFVVEQHVLGQATIPYPVNYQGDFEYSSIDPPPAWIATPYYDTQMADWMGSWTDYTKDYGAYPVEV
jgi:hypothetical protein